jgi:hypothetical protein
LADEGSKRRSRLLRAIDENPWVIVATVVVVFLVAGSYYRNGIRRDAAHRQQYTPSLWRPYATWWGNGDRVVKKEAFPDGTQAGTALFRERDVRNPFLVNVTLFESDPSVAFVPHFSMWLNESDGDPDLAIEALPERQFIDEDGVPQGVSPSLSVRVAHPKFSYVFPYIGDQFSGGFTVSVPMDDFARIDKLYVSSDCRWRVTVMYDDGEFWRD